MRKRILAILLTLSISLMALGGCGSFGAGEDGNITSYNQAGTGSVQAVDGYAEALKGDVVHTYFFDVKLTDGYRTGAYEGISAGAGKELVVVWVEITNTYDSAIPMFADDFQLQWNDEAKDAYAWPLAVQAGDVLPESYELAAGESRKGVLLYEVESGLSEFSISHQEYFGEDQTGSVYFIFFDAPKK